MAKKKFRVLMAATIGAVTYKPNDVVNLEEGIAKIHREQLDGTPAAVSYALSENGNVVKEHPTPAAAQVKEGGGAKKEVKALEAVIADLQARLAEAAEEAKPDLEAELQAKQAELAQLQGE